MSDSKYKIVKEGWGNRPNFQASHGLKMTPEDLEEGERILEALQEANSKKNEPESDWVRRNRERYEAGGRSHMKELAAAQAAQELDFEQTGDPEMDLIIAMGLRDMENEENDPEISHMFEAKEDKPEGAGQGGGAAGNTKPKSKRQQKLERQRQAAALHNAQRR